MPFIILWAAGMLGISLYASIRAYLIIYQYEKQKNE